MTLTIHFSVLLYAVWWLRPYTPTPTSGAQERRNNFEGAPATHPTRYEDGRKWVG